MFKHLLLATAALSLGACALPAQHTDVHSAVSSRLFLYQQPSAGAAVLDVVRSNGLFGGGCATELTIDGRIAAQFQQGERARFYLAPGDHQLEARYHGACEGGVAKLSTHLQAGQPQHLAIGSHGTSLAWAPAGQS